MTPNFTATESLGVPENVTLVDISTSPTPGLTSRRVYFRLANGNYLTTAGESASPAYETWPIADSSITLSILSRSITTDIRVDWMTNDTISETKTVTTCFPLYDYLFAYNLIGSQTSRPGVVQDSNYYSNFSQFIVNLFCAETAATYEDLYSSQQAFERNYVMEQNENHFF
jgi:hypothetical protein